MLNTLYLILIAMQKGRCYLHLINKEMEIDMA